ncbi:hypothetical protein ACQPYE_07490 [Actinosynnema sp. CA-299493]
MPRLPYEVACDDATGVPANSGTCSTNRRPSPPWLDATSTVPTTAHSPPNRVTTAVPTSSPPSNTPNPAPTPQRERPLGRLPPDAKRTRAGRSSGVSTRDSATPSITPTVHNPFLTPVRSVGADG